jgi:uncharacterized coiled-coil DUF342 family protein
VDVAELRAERDQLQARVTELAAERDHLEGQVFENDERI